MTLFRLAGYGSALAFLSGTAAFAEVTPEDVWAKWQEFSTAFGQTVTAGSETRDGDALVVEDVVFTGGDDVSQAAMTVANLTFTDAGDGTVVVTMSEGYELTVTSPDETGEPVKVIVDVMAPGMEVVASGTPEALNHAFDAPELTVALASINDVAAEALGVVVSAGLKGMTGSYESDASAGFKFSSDVQVESIDVTSKVAIPDSGSKFNFDMTMAGLESASSVDLPEGVDMADFAAVVAAGMAVSGGTKFGATTFTFDFADPTGTGAGTGAIGGGNIDVGLEGGAVSYGVGTTGLDITVSGSAIPLPEVKVGLGELAFDFLMPLTKTDAPTGFSFLTRVVDFSVSEDIWGMVDPAGAFPHDPVTFIVDTSGTLKLLADLTSEQAMEAVGEAPPAEIHSADLNELQFSALGAEVTGSGALTFDNSDMQTFPGMPKPDGSITLNATGLNALMEKIGAAGFVPAEELMGFQMMMSMFAVPGEGEDTLTTTIEFKDGGLFANGMQLQ
jgi:Uncharacterized protein conserved in bacteria (DUF2125)